ncbi:MAG: zinc-ribbon domain-containing protein [Candidatus Bathyarchaeia archaeon]
MPKPVPARYCIECGEPLSPIAVYCPRCGTRQP